MKQAIAALGELLVTIFTTLNHICKTWEKDARAYRKSKEKDVDSQ